MGNFNKEGQIKVRESFSKRCLRKFCSETFYNGFENLIQMPKYVNSITFFYFLVRWDASAVSLPSGDAVFAQLACPCMALFLFMLRTTKLSLDKHWLDFDVPPRGLKLACRTKAPA